MSKLMMIIAVALTTYLCGCAAISTGDMIATTAQVRLNKQQKMLKKNNPDSIATPNHFEEFYNNLVNQDQSLWMVNAKAVTDPSIESLTNKLLRTDVVQNLAKRIHSSFITDKQEDTSISSADLTEFAKLISSNGTQSLLEEIQTRDAGVERLAAKLSNNKRVSFQEVLRKYLMAYGSGSFVNRLGDNLSKPTISVSGISDDDIQGLASIFFEALFDCWFSEMPVFYSLNNRVEQVFLPPADNSTHKNGDTESVTLGYRREYFIKYSTPSGLQPTVHAEGIAPGLQIGIPDTQITEDDVKHIQQMAKLAGKQSRSLTGLGLGFFSNINISFVLGADFAIGDNKTLMNLAQTVAEVASYRAAEFASWRIIMSNHDYARDRITARLASVANMPHSWLIEGSGNRIETKTIIEPGTPVGQGTGRP